MIVDSVHGRKAEMSRRTCGYVALPGGIGTMEEVASLYEHHWCNTNGNLSQIFEALTLSQIGFHDKREYMIHVRN